MEPAEVVPAETFADLLSQREALAEQAGMLAPIIERVRTLSLVSDDLVLAWRSLKDEARQALGAAAACADLGTAVTARKSSASDIYIEIERCSQCGAVEAPQPCIGVCIRKVGEFVLRAPYEALASDVSGFVTHCEAAAALLDRICRVTPRDGQWRANLDHFRALAERLSSASSGDIEASAAPTDLVETTSSLRTEPIEQRPSLADHPSTRGKVTRQSGSDLS